MPEMTVRWTSSIDPHGSGRSVRTGLRAATSALLIGTCLVGLGRNAEADTFRFAFQGPLSTLDPYTLNETFTLGVMGNVMEGLIKRGPELEIIPGLAERWEVIEPTRWRFHLRRGVKFHNGNDFNADDVVFSVERVLAPASDLKTRLPADVRVEKVDEHTVDFLLTGPNPNLHYEWDTWYIFDKEWSEANNTVSPSSASDVNPNYAALHANGTGPFMVASHQVGVRTTFKPNPDWWGTPEHNLTEVVFTQIASDPTRVAALLSGEVDMIDPVPIQDLSRVERHTGTRVKSGPELRTIFLGFNASDDELGSSNIKGKNPFKDPNVRKAFYQAIDMEAIKSRVMRDQSVPSALLISPLLYERADEFQRHPFDPDAARKLLADAGYPDGFELTMDCPNDRYVNDEAICQAVVSFLARVGIKVNLLAQTKTKYFAKVLASGGFDTDFYLLGWTPSGFDSLNVITNVAGCRDETGRGGPFNLGGYCNPRVDEIAAQIRVEIDPEQRNQLIFDVFSILHEEVSHIPLHQQTLAWGLSDRVEMVQRADNQILFYWVQMRD
jgi:peptide/nickel transport system substrate-binding protein